LVYTYPEGVSTKNVVFIKRADGKYSVRFEGGPENILELRKTPFSFNGIVTMPHDAAFISGTIEKTAVYGTWKALSGHKGIITGNIVNPDSKH
jgi:hypothetical protein